MKGKTHFLKYYSLIFFCFLLSSNYLFAQDVQIQTKYYTPENGLPNRTVNFITQDSIGFIWIATNKGICKFNGYSFEQFTQKQGLKHDEIKSIHCISNEILWIIYKNLEEECIDVFHTKTQKITPFDVYYKNYLPFRLLKKMNRVLEAANKTFYIGLHDTTGFVSFSQTKLFKYHNYKNNILPLKIDIENNLIAYDNKNNSILHINPNANKIVHSTFHQTSLNSLSYYLYPFSSDYFCFSESVNTTLLKNNIQINSKLKSIETNFFCTLINNNSCFVNDYKIYNVSSANELFDFSQLDNSLEKISNPIHCKFVDEAGTLWIGLEFGLLRVNAITKKFNTLLNNVKYLNKTIAVRGIIENKNKTIYVNTENFIQYAFQFKKQYTSATIKPIKKDEFNYAICKDKNDNIYYYSHKEGAIYKIDENSKMSLLYKTKYRDWVWSMCFVNDHEIWAGTENNGILIFDIKNKTVKPILNNENFINNASFIYQIKYIDDNTIWICSNKGLYKATTTKGLIERYGIEESNKFYLPSNNISFIEPTSSNEIFIASLDKGLLKFDATKGFIKLYSTNDGFTTQTIYAAYDDNKGSIWMPSDNGIIQFNKKLEDVTRIYTTKDGISHNEFNRIAHYKNADSVLFFGGLNGITYFNPKHFYEANPIAKANLAIEEAKVYNGKTGQFINVQSIIQTNKIIELTANDRFISFQLALLNYDKVEDNVYAYKIDNANWILQGNRVIQIAGLSWGEHQISIKAKDKNGVWSNNIIQIKVKQLKPFYLQIWFLLLFSSSLLIAFVIFYKLRIRKLNAQKKLLKQKVDESTFALSQSNMELEELVQQKEILLKEIHHRVKNNLAIISGLLELQSDNTEDTIAKTTLLEGTNRVRSMALIHQKLYQHNNLASIELSDFVSDLYNQIASVMVQNSNAIHFKNNIPIVYLDIDTSIPIGLIINELITNSFKYAFVHNSLPTIIIDFEQPSTDNYVLIYKDNGKGLPEHFNPAQATTLGIKLMHKLAKQLSGSLAYSRREDFSIFTITFKSLEARNKE